MQVTGTDKSGQFSRTSIQVTIFVRDAGAVRLLAFLSKITPYAIQSKIVAKKFKDKEKDAF